MGWKDEQFGLTFLAALNNLEGRQGQIDAEEKTLTNRAALFIMLYCFAAAISVYNFTMSMAEMHSSNKRTTYILERSFNALLPCLFAHTLLALNSAVIKTPKGAPFRQLYFLCRFFVVLMIVTGTDNFVETLVGAREAPAF